VKRRGGWKPEYFVPRFIADCARASGFAGIRFQSPRHYDRNLVLFAWSDDGLIPEGEPSIIKLSAIKDDEPFPPPVLGAE